MRDASYLSVLALGLALGGPAAAEVAASGESGFVSHNEVLIDRSPSEVWDVMLRPGSWWNGAHTYSGDANNMTIEPAAGGCFCETVPDARGGPSGQIEHMRVVYLAPGSTLRMTGGLGPLQSEAVTGALTMTLAPEGSVTKVSWDYVVGGYMRMQTADIAPLVDQVIGEQLLRLATHLGAKVDPAPRRGGGEGF